MAALILMIVVVVFWDFDWFRLDQDSGFGACLSLFVTSGVLLFLFILS